MLTVTLIVAGVIGFAAFLVSQIRSERPPQHQRVRKPQRSPDVSPRTFRAEDGVDGLPTVDATPFGLTVSGLTAAAAPQGPDPSIGVLGHHLDMNGYFPLSYGFNSEDHDG